MSSYLRTDGGEDSVLVIARLWELGQEYEDTLRYVHEQDGVEERPEDYEKYRGLLQRKLSFGEECNQSYELNVLGEKVLEADDRDEFRNDPEVISFLERNK